MDDMQISGCPPPGRPLKRALDIAGAVAALLICSPLWIVLPLLILCKDGPPVLHRDYRLGRGGVRFPVLKFRTLRTGATPHRPIAPENDPRITTTGHWLRRWRLDEIPQLLNVIAGSMSLVGPRPMQAEHANSLPASKRHALLAVRPGITGPAAIHFLGDDAVLAEYEDAETIYLEKLLPAKTELQLDYLRHWSLRKDLLIILQTLRSLWSTAQRKRSAEYIRRLLQ